MGPKIETYHSTATELLGGAIVALIGPDLADISGELQFFSLINGMLPFILLLYLQNGSYMT
jgi:hypothetical protein